jgi:hypothetical protein
MNFDTHNEQFNEIYQVIEHMSTVKKIEDKMDYRMKEIVDCSKTVVKENDILGATNRQLLDDKDKYLNQSKELIIQKEKLLKEKVFSVDFFRESRKEMTEEN